MLVYAHTSTKIISFTQYSDLFPKDINEAKVLLRKLQKQWHPDHCNDSKAKDVFIKIMELHELGPDNIKYSGPTYTRGDGVECTFKPEDISEFFSIIDLTNIYNEWQKGTSYSFLNLNELNKFLLMDKPYNCAKYNNIGISCIDHIKSLDNYVYIDNIDDIQELPRSSSFDSFKDVLSSRLLDVHHDFSNILEFSKPYN